MNCPKCKLLLFIDRENKLKEIEYHCIGCGLHGTVKQMQLQKKRADEIFQKTLARVRCKICDTMVPVSETKIINYGISQALVCRKHGDKRKY